MATFVAGRNSVAYLNVGCQVVNSLGSPASADANPVAAFYRVDGLSGNMVLDILVGTGGLITMSPVVGVPGLYSCPVEVSTLLHKQYRIRVTYDVSSVPQVTTHELMLLTELDVLSRDAISPLTSTSLTTMVLP